MGAERIIGSTPDDFHCVRRYAAAPSSLYIIPPTHAAGRICASPATVANAYVVDDANPAISQSMWKRKPQSQTTRPA